MWLIVIISVLVFLFLVLAVWGVGVYRYNWNDPITRRMLRVVPYPAMVVEGQVVTMNEFYKQLDILTYFSDNLFALAPKGSQALNETDKREGVTSKIVKDRLVASYLEENQVDITEEDKTRKLQEILASDLDEQQIREAVGSIYGTSLEDFRRYFVEPLARMERAEKFLQESSSVAELRLKAEQVRKDIEAKVITFESAARANSNHSSAVNGGDLGYFPRGERLPLLEEKIFSLAVGQMSDILETETGFHLVLLEDKKEVEVEGQKQEQVRVRYIFWAQPTLEEWLEKAIKEKKIQSFVD